LCSQAVFGKIFSNETVVGELSHINPRVWKAVEVYSRICSVLQYSHVLNFQQKVARVAYSSWGDIVTVHRELHESHSQIIGWAGGIVPHEKLWLTAKG